MKTFAKKVILKNKAKSVLAGKYYGIITMLLFFCMISLFFQRFTISLNRVICYKIITAFGITASNAIIIVLSYLIPLLTSILMNVLQAGLCLLS